jgi:isopentenyl diphosphate isomerase/L-lactate dehydrogenase-like FMN-dependent dehydrogenase
MVFDFLDGAAQSESTAQANRAALASLGIVPGPLRDVSNRTAALEIFGRHCRLPLRQGKPTPMIMKDLLPPCEHDLL